MAIPGASGETIYALAFTCEEIDYLDNRQEAEVRRGRNEFVAELDAHGQAQASQAAAPSRRADPRPARA